MYIQGIMKVTLSLFPFALFWNHPYVLDIRINMGIIKQCVSFSSERERAN